MQPRANAAAAPAGVGGAVTLQRPEKRSSSGSPNQAAVIRPEIRTYSELNTQALSPLSLHPLGLSVSFKSNSCFYSQDLRARLSGSEFQQVFLK